MNALSNFCRCEPCSGELEISLKTCCLATKIVVVCKSSECPHEHGSDPPLATTSTHAANDDKLERMTDYATNVLCALAFLSCGDGGTDATKALRFPGPPNDTTMSSRSFHVTLERAGPFIGCLSDELMLENLREEVRLSMTWDVIFNEQDCQLWLQSIDSLDCCFATS